MPKQGAKRRKTRTHKEDLEEDVKMPRSFIIHRKKIKGPIKELLKNTREVMYPQTGMKLNESEKIRMKDYLKASGHYGVTHMMVFTSTEKHNYLKIIKTPSGPTLTFKIQSYCLMQDILDAQTKLRSFPRLNTPPMLVMNGFPSPELTSLKQYKLVSSTLQSCFAPLNVATQKISQLKRAVYLTYDDKTDCIQLRHYHLDSTPRNINKNLKRVLKTSRIPDLSRFDDISEYFLKNNANVSDSENEDLPGNMIEYSTKSQISSKGLQQQQALRLHEIGPRMKLKLQKIEEGVLKGNVLYHRFVSKTAEEVLDQRTKVQKKIQEKDERRNKMQEILNAKLEEKNLKKSRFKKDDGDEEEEKEQEEDQDHDEYDPQMDEDLSDDYDYYVNREGDQDDNAQEQNNNQHQDEDEDDEDEDQDDEDEDDNE